MSDSFDPYYKWLGIQPKDQPATLYRLLGVELFESDPDVIENAADQRMLHVRSFQGGVHQARSQSLLNEIAAARVRLLDPQQKREYDDSLRRAMAAARPQPLPVAAAPIPQVFAAPAPMPVAPRPISAPSPPAIRAAPASAARRKTNLQNGLVMLALGGLGLAVAGFLVLESLREDPKAPRASREVRRQSEQPQSVTRKEKSVAPSVNPPPAPSRLPPLRGEVEAQAFVWQRGEQPLDLGPAAESFITTSWLAGYFLGNGEWYRVEIDEAGNYRLQGSGVQPVGVTITRVRSPYRAWFEKKVESFSWRKGEPRVKLIHQRDGFAVLSGVTGCLLGPEHAVSVFIDSTDGYWYLDGATNFDTRGQAVVYRFKEPGKFQPDVQQIEWNPEHQRQRMFPIEEGLCTIARVSGAFKGYGENLNAMAEGDGHWHIWGYTKAHYTRGGFVSLRFNTPPLLALSPAKPAVKLAPVSKPE